MTKVRYKIENGKRVSAATRAVPGAAYTGGVAHAKGGLHLAVRGSPNWQPGTEIMLDDQPFIVIQRLRSSVKDMAVFEIDGLTDIAD